MPNYLLVIVQDYLKDRRLSFETQEGMKFKEVTTGATQRSILGPELWNVFYDGLLRLDMPQNVFLVGYAEDVAAVIRARTPELAQMRLDQVMIKVNRWMTSHGLELAVAKTEIVMLNRKRIITLITMNVGEVEVRMKIAAEYLGVTLDCQLRFWKHR